MTESPLVIRGRHRLPLWRRLRDAALTVAMWAFYVVLTREAFYALAGWSGLVPGMDLAVYVRQATDLLPTLGEYAVAIVVDGAILVGWALYNQIRFRGRETRRGSLPVTVAELAAQFHVELPDLDRLRAAARMVMLHMPDGRLLSVATPPVDHPLAPIAVAAE